MKRKLHMAISLALLGFVVPNFTEAQVKDSIQIQLTIRDSASKEPLNKGTVEWDGGITKLNDFGNVIFKSLNEFPLKVKVSVKGYPIKNYLIEQANTTLWLDSNSHDLTEVVIVGYGKQNRKDVTGSIAHIDGSALENMPVQSFDQTLSGKAAGVSVALPNGVLNAPPVIRIRGINSVSLSSYPLIVVDGIPINTGNVSTSTNVVNNPLGDINPDDIASVDVLKDAASTAIYGSRAAAGVLIVTTKRGKKGRISTNYNSWIGITKAVRLPKLLDAQQYMDIKNEAVNNSKILTGNANNNSVDSALFFPSYNSDGSLVNTNWYDYVYQTGVSENNSINVSGASEKTNYYLSADYSNQNGFLVGNNFKRKSIRFNLEHNLTSFIKLKAGANYNNSFNKSYNSGSLPNTAQLLVGAARLAMALPSNVSAYNEDGSFNLSSTGTIGMGNNTATSTLYNPLALFDYSRFTSENDHIIANVGANVKFLKHFEFATLYSIDRLKVENQSYQGPEIGSSAYSSGGSAANISTTINNWDWTNTINFNNSWGHHDVNILVGTDNQQIKNSIWGASASVASDDYFQYYQGGWTNVVATGNALSTQAFVSGFGRLNYDFDHKYFFTANVRRDGNSALADGHKYGNFGGVSAGWAISKEKFFTNSSISKVVSNLKLRGSYGKVGNGNLSSNYAAMNLYSASLYGSSSTWSLSQVGNNNLSWETSKQTNVGADVSFLNNKYQLEFTYFNNNVDGLILSVPQSASKGIPDNTILQNIGSMYNRGIELTISGQIIQTKTFSWNSSLNYSHIINKVTALADDADIIGYTHTSANSNNVTRVGYSISSLYGAKTDGVNPANGQRIFINAEGEKVQYSAAVENGQSHWTYLDGSTAPAIGTSDYYLLANALPKYYGGWNNSFSWKNLDLNVNITYAGGNYIMNGTKATLRDQTAYNNYTGILDRWTHAGQQTDIPRLVYNDVISNGTSFPVSSNVEKGDFIRLQNILLGYRFSKNTLKADWISSLRLYVQASNLFLITKYTGLDPEISSNGNSNTSIGVERNSVGQGRTFTFGINASF
ncbi:SusC/RagA family TonB-linked outer membrane protein [Rhizosphaericola mali]|uniref:SusC/RagA family TonB-linked outer membrane protein n=1 Tax=Rhizosphaericola mali TaxID=2545455 RepID=A0A5P2G2H5_9BACT|nr:SusC/RagA family TonB-linked outer membrane protein [Rhizosphaericola mali]QES88299.1 SusC/RagA family TonB-linked outer membrane protein [Rhizosphaericola mali]